MALRPTRRPRVASIHWQSFFRVHPWPGSPWSIGSESRTASTIRSAWVGAKKGGAAVGAAVGQALGPSLMVAVDPGQDGVILAAMLCGPGGGIMGAIGDLGEGQEPLTGPGVRGV